MLSRKSIVAAAVILLFCAIVNRAQAQFQPGEFVSFSADAWGVEPSAGNAAELMLANFDSVYVDGNVEVGVAGPAGLSMVFTTAQVILDYQPSGGGASFLNNDLVDPTTSSSGAFGGYVLALQNDVDFADAGFLGGSAGVPFADLVLHDLAAPYRPSLNGLTVRQFLAEANFALGGSDLGRYTVTDLAVLTEEVSRAFEGGQPSQFAQDHLRRVPEPTAVALALLGWTGLRLRRSGRKPC
jgi:hypothetical protein